MRRQPFTPRGAGQDYGDVAWASALALLPHDGDAPGGGMPDTALAFFDSLVGGRRAAALGVAAEGRRKRIVEGDKYSEFCAYRSYFCALRAYTWRPLGCYARFNGDSTEGLCAWPGAMQRRKLFWGLTIIKAFR